MLQKQLNNRENAFLIIRMKGYRQTIFQIPICKLASRNAVETVRKYISNVEILKLNRRFSCKSSQTCKQTVFWLIKKRTSRSKGWYTYEVHENCPIFKTPHPPYPSTSKILRPPWLWTSNFNQTPPPSPNDNQAITRKHNPSYRFVVLYSLCVQMPIVFNYLHF